MRGRLRGLDNVCRLLEKCVHKQKRATGSMRHAQQDTGQRNCMAVLRRRAHTQRAQDAAAIGEEVYEQHCQSCHGEKLRSAGAMPDLRDLGENDRAKFDTMVMDGRGQMPAWQGIVSPLELDQLWAYIRSRAR